MHSSSNSYEAVEISPLLKMYSEYELASGEQTICSDEKILKLTFFGRTDLRISLSRAKFDEKVDFEVRSAVALQIHTKLAKKQNFAPKFSPKKNVWCQKIKRPKLSETHVGKVSKRSERVSKTHEKFSPGIRRSYLFPLPHVWIENHCAQMCRPGRGLGMLGIH